MLSMIFLTHASREGYNQAIKSAADKAPTQTTQTAVTPAEKLVSAITPATVELTAGRIFESRYTTGRQTLQDRYRAQAYSDLGRTTTA